MKHPRSGAALLWLLLLIGFSITIVAASLSVSRSSLWSRTTTLERADGLFYAEVALEQAMTFVRQNTAASGRLHAGTRRVHQGTLPTSGVPMRYLVDLRDYNSVTNRARTINVTITPEPSDGSEARPFTARARLREDLTVGEWFVMDHEVGDPTSPAYSLPKFASCSAEYARVTSGGAGGFVGNEVRWSFANEERPDEIRISWHDFRRNREESLSASGASLAGASGSSSVRTPWPSSPSEPVDVPYLLEAVFEGRVVDSCVVDVVSGKALLEVHPTTVCAWGDTVTVTWRGNTDAYIRVDSVEQYFPFTTRRIPRADGESGSVAIPIVRTSGNPLLYYQVKVRFPSSIGGTRREYITIGC